MSDHNQEIVVSKTEGSASSYTTNPWDDLSDQFNKGGGSAPVDADLDRVSESMEKRGAYVNQELLAHLKVAKYEIIRLGWQEDPNRLILYPGSNSDRTMTEVFGNQVVHIDPDDKALALLQKKGFRTEQMNIKDYVANMSDGEQIGIILSYNAGLVPDSALERLQEGGIILANNWHGSADDLHSKKGLELIGAVVQGTEDFIAGPTAENLLGMQCFVYSAGGHVNENPTEEEIGQARADADVVFEEYRSPDSLWIFCKNSSKSE